MIPLFLVRDRHIRKRPVIRLRPAVAGLRRDRRDALEEVEFMPPRVEVRDFVARRFQLSFQIENLRARFRIEIRYGSRPS
jgi:hypothetical protein